MKMRDRRENKQENPQPQIDVSKLKLPPICKRLLEKERRKIRKQERKRVEVDEQEGI